MKIARRHLERALLAIPLLVLFAALPTASRVAASGEEDRDTFVDEEFHFRVKKTDGRGWSFKEPGKSHGSLRVQIDHLIGGKKDFIRILFHAWDTKSKRTSEKIVQEQLVASMKKEFSEIREQESKEKDRFGRYKSSSFRLNGRLAGERGEIRYMKLHVFKYRNTLYAVVIVHEPGMDEKYADDLKYIEKNFRAG